MNKLIEIVEKSQLKKNIPDFRPGDTVSGTCSYKRRE
jgi:ribosomal protein L19